MKFKMKNDELLRGLNLVQPAVSSKSVVPACEYVLLEVKPKYIILKTTNLNQSIITSVTPEVAEECSFMVNFNELYNFVNKLSDLSVEFTVTENTCRIKSALFNAKLSILPESEFPVVKSEIESEFQIELTYGDLNKIYESVCGFASKDNAYGMALTGTLFDINNEVIEVVGASNHHIARLVFPNKFSEFSEEAKRYILEREFVNCLKSFKKEDLIACKFNEKYIQFESETLTFRSTLINENFPDYKVFTSKFQINYEYEFSRLDLLTRLSAAVDFVDKSKYQINLDFEDTNLKVIAMNEAFEKELVSEMHLQSDRAAKIIKIAFNINELIKTVKAFHKDDDQLIIQINQPNSGVFIKSKNNPESYFVYLVPILREDLMIA